MHKTFSFYVLVTSVLVLSCSTGGGDSVKADLHSGDESGTLTDALSDLGSTGDSYSKDLPDGFKEDTLDLWDSAPEVFLDLVDIVPDEMDLFDLTDSEDIPDVEIWDVVDVEDILDILDVVDIEDLLDEEIGPECSWYFADYDEDDFGIEDSQCLLEPVYPYTAEVSGDCDDDNAAVHPDAAETCNGIDDNCDTFVDEGAVCPENAYYCDGDLDGVISNVPTGTCDWSNCVPDDCTTTPGGDCDDGNALANPDMAEDCDTDFDDDCDGQTDEVGALNCLLFGLDSDEDGYYQGEDNTVCRCLATETYVATLDGDCDDSNNQIYPEAEESCNGIDDNCDDSTDEGNVCPEISYYCDEDLDGYRSAFYTGSCDWYDCVPAECSLEAGEDCNDDAPEVNPGKTEDCSTEIDDNCDGETDQIDALNCTLFGIDSDVDGYYEGEETAVCRCLSVAPYVATLEGDCNDQDGSIYPGATEVCNGIDDDCDGFVEPLGTCGTTEFYCDGDEDGHLAIVLADTCDTFECLPDGCELNPGDDCDDSDPEIHPAHLEDCLTDYDDNCNQLLDEDGSLNCSNWYLDVDRDGYYPESGEARCRCNPVGQYDAMVPGDCNDDDAEINPDGTETCNGIDDDCANGIDDGVCPYFAYYCDEDGDGIQSSWLSGQCNTYLCVPLGCGFAPGGDCNDDDENIYPGAPEDCATDYDDDCDSFTNELEALNCIPFYYDNDQDGFAAPDAPLRCQCKASGLYNTVELGDCDDDKDWLSPGTIELCNGIDDNCDGDTDEGDTCDQVDYFCDMDEDGFISSQVTDTCSAFGCVPEGCELEAGSDCDDDNLAIQPDATEVCDGVDQDCDDVVDGPGVCPVTPYFCDSDLDGHPSLVPTGDCDAFQCVPEGCVEMSGDDCDDSAASVYPGAGETCNGIDDNCQGGIDEGGVCPTSSYYCDNDQDGHFSKVSAGQCNTYQCAPEGCSVAAGDDCNDVNSAVHPGQAEKCGTLWDDNCDSKLDELDAEGCTVRYADMDGDGFAPDGPLSECRCNAVSPYSTTQLGDCADDDSQVFPGSFEVCNGYDDNCDGAVDESNVCDTEVYYCDTDNDGYISLTVTGSCDAHDCVPAGCILTPGTDCNDDLDNVHPEAVEDCLTPYDDNCDGNINHEDSANCVQHHLDADLDGHGLETDSRCLCTPDGDYTALAPNIHDCDDTDPSIHPNAAEMCNGIDDNCQGGIDEGNVCPTLSYYCDEDTDTFISKFESSTCQAFECIPEGCQATAGTDCNDGDSLVFPGAVESCATAYDDNCNGTVNELNATACSNFHRDFDTDGFGSITQFECWCAPSGDFVISADLATDCNDENSAVSPNATETCNGIDDNCDGAIDEGSICPTIEYFCDSDDDGYRSSVVTSSCDSYECVPGECLLTAGLDCNDDDNLVHPGATENCATTYDDNCDGETNERFADNCVQFYVDADEDGFGHLTTSQCWCAPVPGYGIAPPLNTDCNDADPAINPDAAELCDGIDQNCDETLDEGVCVTVDYYCDNDGDGSVSLALTGSCSSYNCLPEDCQLTAGTDCNDTRALVYPGAVENCATTYDDNCNEVTNEQNALNCALFYSDGDEDGFGHLTDSQCWCQGTSQYPIASPGNTDCNDGDGTINPVAAEACNGLDENCNSLVDENACPTIDYYCDNDDDGVVSLAVSDNCSEFECVPAECQTTPGADCNDANNAIHPMAAENCATEADDNCNGVTNEQNADNCTLFYVDSDGDGFGHPTLSECWCFEESGSAVAAPLNTDCNDADDTIYPGATELCNGVDEDCDTVLDEEACPTLEYFCDEDADGYISDSVSGSCTAFQCIPTQCQASAGLDCDDELTAVNPDATEDCATLYDDNCNGSTNAQNGLSCTDFFVDFDGDGFGHPTNTECWCAEVPGVVSEPLNTDCDDTKSTIYPGALESCDGVDENCDTVIDDGFCTIGGICYDPQDINPNHDCLWCDPTLSISAWSPADGQPCDDGLAWSSPDICAGETCLGQTPECFDTRVFDDTIRVQSLVVGDDGTPGQGLNVDGNASTCAPNLHCSNGIDNQLSVVDEIINNELVGQITGGNIHLLLEFEGFNTTGAPFQVNLYPANLVPGCDFTQPGCSYRVSKSLFDSECNAVYFTENATVVGNHLTAGGTGSTFALTIPITSGIVISITINNAMLDGTVTVVGGEMVEFDGIMAGAMDFQELMTAVQLVPADFFPDPPGKAGTIQLLSLLLKPDLDLDLNGVKESVSLGFLISGNQAYVSEIY